MSNNSSMRSVVKEDVEKKLISITEKLKIQDSELNMLRKDLNNNIRESIAFKAINKSKNKKALDKSGNFMNSFKQDLKMIHRDIREQIREEQSDYYTVSKKFDLLHDDLEKINKLMKNIEDRIKICETDVGIIIK
jgi:hypothetical protein